MHTNLSRAGQIALVRIGELHVSALNNEDRRIFMSRNLDDRQPSARYGHCGDDYADAQVMKDCDEAARAGFRWVDGVWVTIYGGQDRQRPE